MKANAQGFRAGRSSEQINHPSRPTPGHTAVLVRSRPNYSKRRAR